MTLAEAEKDSILLTSMETDVENLETEQDENLDYVGENQEES